MPSSPVPEAKAETASRKIAEIENNILNGFMFASSISNNVATGLETIREESGSQVGVQQGPVIKRTVNFRMTVNAGEFGSESGVLCSMAGRDRMTLQAGAAFRLIQQPIAIGAVRIVAFQASPAVSQMIAGGRMLKREGTGFIGMTIL